MRRLLGILVALSIVLTGCGAAAVATPTAKVAKEITLGLGYIPSVQFAPFYVARDKGYYTQEGINITFKHGNEDDFLKLVGTNQMQYMIGSGEQVILGRAQGLPVVYAMRWYNKFPVVIFSLKDKGIAKPQDLVGKKIGIPGLYGASYIGWKALVYSQKLNEKEITLLSIGFTQAAAVTQGQVDAANDYIVSGPVQLRLAGKEVNVIRVSDYLDIPSNGLVTNEQTIKDHSDELAAMIRATLKGLADTLKNPDEAFKISLKYVPEAGGDNEKTNRAIFDESLALWSSSGTPGASNADAWKTTAQFMRAAGLIDKDVKPEDAFTNRFVEGK